MTDSICVPTTPDERESAALLFATIRNHLPATTSSAERVAATERIDALAQHVRGCLQSKGPLLSQQLAP